MKRIFAILFIVLIIISICVVEEITLSQTNQKLDEYSNSLSAAIIENKDNLNNEQVLSEFKKLDNFWQDTKIKLCYLTNYEKIKTMDESLIKLEASIEYNDESLAIENISLIKSYSEFLHYFMGFNFNNLF